MVNKAIDTQKRCTGFPRIDLDQFRLLRIGWLAFGALPAYTCNGWFGRAHMFINSLFIVWMLFVLLCTGKCSRTFYCFDVQSSWMCLCKHSPGDQLNNDVIDEMRTIHLAMYCTLFAQEIDDCLWICCFSCSFNQMALNDDRDLRWMQEIYFQTFSQCAPCP